MRLSYKVQIDGRQIRCDEAKVQQKEKPCMPVRGSQIESAFDRSDYIRPKEYPPPVRERYTMESRDSVGRAAGGYLFSVCEGSKGPRSHVS